MSSSTTSHPSGSGPHGRGGPFLLQLAGLPSQYSWKDLKDSVRSDAKHSIWTDVQVVAHNDRRGSIKLKTWSEAYGAYKHIIETPIAGRIPFTELWDITDSPPELMRRNCNPDANAQQAQHQHVRRVYQSIAASDQATTGHQSQMMRPNTNSIYANPMQASSQGYQMSSMQPSMSGSQVSPAQIAQYQQQQAKYQQYQQQQVQYQQQHALQGYPYSQGALQQQIVALEQQMMGMYVRTPTGLPVNVSRGATKTEARGVFVQNLPFKATDSQLAHYFGKAGTVAKQNFPKDATKGVLKGFGTVTYSSLEDAQRAVALFNGKEFMGRKLAVRFDTEQTALNPPREPQPLVVDGSGLSKNRSC